MVFLTLGCIGFGKFAVSFGVKFIKSLCTVGENIISKHITEPILYDALQTAIDVSIANTFCSESSEIINRSIGVAIMETIFSKWKGHYLYKLLSTFNDIMLWQFAECIYLELIDKDATLLEKCIIGLLCISVVHGIHGYIFCSKSFSHYFWYGFHVSIVWWFGEKFWEESNIFNSYIIDIIGTSIFVGFFAVLRGLMLGYNPYVWFYQKFYTCVLECIGYLFNLKK